MASTKRNQKPKSSAKSAPEAKRPKKSVQSDDDEISEKEASQESEEEYKEPKESESDVPSQEPSDDDEKPGFVKNDSGEYFMKLPGAAEKRLTVRTFKGKTYVDIREFYEKDGKFLPGKKGISLSAEQWEALKNNSAEVDKCIKLL